ncbi:MAG TPA: hypothetical protein VFA49_14935 [Chloroflexota bacterium]|nr:hypothetical protein [Chloroflexota bacterium]
MRGEPVTWTAPVPPVAALPREPSIPAANVGSVDYEFQTNLVDIDDLLAIRNGLKETPGVLDVTGGETKVSIRFDKTRLDDARLKQRLAELGHPVN